MYRKLLLFFVLTLFLTGCAQESEIETEDSVSLLDDVIEELREPVEEKYILLDIEQLTGERYYYYLVVDDFLRCVIDSKDRVDEIMNEYMMTSLVGAYDYVEEIKAADGYYFIETGIETGIPDEEIYISDVELVIPVLLHFDSIQSNQIIVDKVFYFTVKKIVEADDIWWEIIDIS